MERRRSADSAVLTSGHTNPGGSRSRAEMTSSKMVDVKDKSNMRRIIPPANDLESQNRDLHPESNRDDSQKERSCDLIRPIRPPRAINSDVVGMTSSGRGESVVTSPGKPCKKTSGSWSSKARDQSSENRVSCGRSLLEDERFTELLSSLTEVSRPACERAELRPTSDAIYQVPTRLRHAGTASGHG